MRAGEAVENPSQLRFRGRTYFEPHRLGRVWRIIVVVFGVGKLLAVQKDCNGGYGGEAVEESTRVDLRGSLGEGRAPFLGLGGGSFLLLLPSRKLHGINNVSLSPSPERAWGESVVGRRDGGLHGGAFWRFRRKLGIPIP